MSTLGIAGGHTCLGSILDLSGSSEFLSRFTELYLPSFLANVVVGLLLGALGLFVILRRMVFLSAALSQVAGAGLALAFFLGALVAHQAGVHTVRRAQAPVDEVLDKHKPEDKDDEEIKNFLDDDDEPDGQGTMAPMTATTRRPTPGSMAIPADKAPAPAMAPSQGAPAAMVPRKAATPAKPPAMATSPPSMAVKGEVPGYARHGRHEPISPLTLSLMITILVALLLSGLGSQSWRTTRESTVGGVFILASAASIILAQLAEKGAHEIAEFLFGAVIFIPPPQQRLIWFTGVGTLVIYGWLFKDFVFVSFDPTAARASRFPVRLTNAVLFVLIAVSIAVCTRAVGAMPVFALTVLPAIAALQIHNRMGPAVVTSALIGAGSAAGGYFLSGLLNLSAGPLIVVTGSLVAGLTWLGRVLVRLVQTRRARRQSNPSLDCK